MQSIKLWPIFLVVFLNMLGFGIIIPIIRDLTELLVKNSNLNESYFAVYSGILMASYSLFQFIFAPMLGSISDRVGRKKILILATSGSIISYLMWSISNTYYLFLISRIFAGITGASLSVAQSYIADVTTEKNRAKFMGAMGAIFGIGFIIGPFLGGVLSDYNISNYVNVITFNQYSLIGIAAAGLSIINLIWIIFGLKESLELKKQSRVGLNIITVLFGSKKPDSPIGASGKRLILVYFLMQLGFNHIEAVLAWDLKDRFQLGTRETGYFFAFMGVVLVIVQGGIYRVLLKKLSLIIITQIGLFLLIVGFLIMPISNHLILMGFITAILAHGLGISNPSVMTLASINADKENQGLTMGVLQSSGSLSRIVAPIASTLLYDTIGHSSPYIASATLIAIGLYIIIKYKIR